MIFEYAYYNEELREILGQDFEDLDWAIDELRDFTLTNLARVKEHEPQIDIPSSQPSLPRQEGETKTDQLQQERPASPEEMKASEVNASDKIQTDEDAIGKNIGKF